MKENLREYCLQVGRKDEPFNYTLQMVEQGAISREELLQAVCDDRNLLNSATVKQCIDHGLLTKEGLEAGGINEQFIDMLGKQAEDVLPNVGRIDRITWDAKEVYFWGIPSSGKTCAMGTILAAARGATVAKCMKVEPCQGHLYQMILSQIFKREDFYCMLPGRTPVDTNFAIRTVLEDWERKDHPVTLIDMAGELFCAILWDAQGVEGNISDKHKDALRDFQNMLVTQKSNNPKHHFFIIEYTEEEKKYKGFDQDTYLEYGLTYLEKNGVLADAKNGLYVIVTKTDLVGRNIPEGEDPNKYLLATLNKRYPNFFGRLQSYCQRNHINGGNFPPPIPFDIGEVCFQNLCQVKTERSQRIVQILMEDPQPEEKKRERRRFHFPRF